MLHVIVTLYMNMNKNITKLAPSVQLHNHVLKITLSIEVHATCGF